VKAASEPEQRLRDCPVDQEDVDIPVITGITRPALGNVIDFAKLSRKRQESDEASTLLHRVFSENERTVLAEGDRLDSNPMEAKGLADERFPGLESQYIEIVDFFLERDGRVDKEEFDALASKLGTFPDGALEAINDWAFSQFDEPLIEEGEPLMMQVHLLKQLQEAV
jgi:hypothetical protein